MKRIARRFRELLGADELHLIRALDCQMGSAISGARLARDTAAGVIPTEIARARIGAIEHEGDQHRGRLVEALGRALVTPFDREDLFRLSRSIDDVLDNLRDFVREYDLFEYPADSMLLPVLSAIAEGLERLRAAVASMLDEPGHLTRGALAAKKIGNQVRHEYQRALSDMFSGEEVTVTLLKRRELLRRLDVVGLRLGEAADALADGAMKRSH